METQAESETSTPQATGCCPPFDPAPYRDREIQWDNELFVKTHVSSLFHVPINIKSRVTHASALIEAADARPAQQLMLGDERSAWSSDLYIHVTKQVPNADMATLSGTFLTRVYEGAFSNAGKWADDMREFVGQRGKKLEHMYFGYTTCPACSKAYGKNYVVVFAKVA